MGTGWRRDDGQWQGGEGWGRFIFKGLNDYLSECAWRRPGCLTPFNRSLRQEGTENDS